MAVLLRKGKYGDYYGNDYMTSNALNDEQMKVNALYIYKYLIDKNWTINAISALLGNMEAESTINPGRWQSDLVAGSPQSHGYSLCQWTPYTNYTLWCEQNGYSDPSEMDIALSRIIYELENNLQWIGRGDYSDMSFKDFSESSESIGYLAVGFLLCYERPADQSESVQAYRSSLALKWYNSVGSTITSNFKPRYDDSGIEGSYYYYGGNPFHQSGYGLPNCTTYAWGRFWEISDLSDGTGDYSNRPTLPTGDAGTWFPNVSGYDTGNYPMLGAVICWSDDAGGAGHVGIVEEIKENGDIIVSQSGWGASKIFWLTTIYKANGYSYTGKTFQGFIYNPHVKYISPPSDGGVKKKRKGFNFVLFNRNRRFV